MHTRLRLPSGARNPGGLFDSWFWITLPVTVVSVVLQPAQVYADQTAQGMVNLSGAAPADAGASQDLFQVTASLDLSQAKGGLTIIAKPPS